jgi:hypothetical protein
MQGAADGAFGSTTATWVYVHSRRSARAAVAAGLEYMMVRSLAAAGTQPTSTCAAVGRGRHRGHAGSVAKRGDAMPVLGRLGFLSSFPADQSRTPATLLFSLCHDPCPWMVAVGLRGCDGRVCGRARICGAAGVGQKQLQRRFRKPFEPTTAVSSSASPSPRRNNALPIAHLPTCPLAAAIDLVVARRCVCPSFVPSTTVRA